MEYAFFKLPEMPSHASVKNVFCNILESFETDTYPLNPFNLRCFKVDGNTKSVQIGENGRKMAGETEGEIILQTEFL